MPDFLRSAAGDPVAGREGELRLCGEAAFTVEEFAVAEIATALGMSEQAARTYVGQALELRERLPRLWGRVTGGDLPAFKARMVATETIPLNAAAADYVDRHLAPFAHQVSVARILRAVRAAMIRHDPDRAAEQAAKAADHRGVWVHHDDEDLTGTGLARINAVTDTPDAVALHTALNDVAATLAALGDSDTDQVRRARALGVLADPQYALDLAATVEHNAAVPDEEATSRLRRRPSRTAPVLHVHLHTDAVTGIAPKGTAAAALTPGVVRAEGAGVTPAGLSTETYPLARRHRSRHGDQADPGGGPQRTHRGRRLRNPRPDPRPDRRARPLLRHPLVRQTRTVRPRPPPTSR